MKDKRNRLILLGLFALLILAVAVSFYIGRYPITIKEVAGIIASRFVPLEQTWAANKENILFNVRLPRIILALLVGCCLSVAGAAYQGIFNNPMASPDLLGASAGAAFGAALGIMNYVPSQVISIYAFVFSIIAVATAIFISERAKGSKTLGLLLSGIMVGSLFQAATSYLKLVADPTDQLPAITFWLMGSLAGTGMRQVLFAVIPMVIGLVPIFLLRWQMNLLTMGDEEAGSMGVNTKGIRLIVILSATLITAASVSVSGMIGFVGLVVPHLARGLVGDNYKHLLPTSMLVGAIFLLLVDNVSRTLWTSEIPIGILTSFVGAPFFLYLIVKDSGNIQA